MNEQGGPTRTAGVFEVWIAATRRGLIDGVTVKGGITTLLRFLRPVYPSVADRPHRSHTAAQWLGVWANTGKLLPAKSRQATSGWGEVGMPVHKSASPRSHCDLCQGCCHRESETQRT